MDLSKWLTENHEENAYTYWASEDGNDLGVEHEVAFPDEIDVHKPWPGDSDVEVSLEKAGGAVLTPQWHDKLKKTLEKTLTNEKKVKRREAAVKGMHRKADKLEKELKATRFKGRITVDIGNLQRRLSIQGEIPSDIRKAFERDQKNVEYVLTEYVTNTLTYIEKAGSAYRDLLKDGSGDVSAFLKEIAPGTAVQETIPSDGLIGNLYLESTKRAKDQRNPTKALNSIRKTAITPKFARRLRAGDTKEVTLSDHDLKQLITVMRLHARQLEALNTAIPQTTKKLTTMTQQLVEGKLSPPEDKALATAMANLYKTTPSAITAVVPGMIGQLLMSAETALRVVEKAISRIRQDAKDGKETA